MIFYPTNKILIKTSVILPVILWAVLICQVSDGRTETGPFRCTVLISMKIRPYIEAVEGMRDIFNRIPQIDSRFFYLEEIHHQAWLDEESSIRDKYQQHAVIAVGPEAVEFMAANPPGPDVHHIFSMILNPSSLLPRTAHFCGVYLSIDPEEQFRQIGNTLPDIRHIGILYDPDHNADYLAGARAAALKNGLVIHPLQVTSKEDVADLLRKSWEEIDGLMLIPDATVISSTLVKYIIKDGISNHVPVIGYNRFFINSGALMAFVYDYKDVGRQTAELAADRMTSGLSCGRVPAQFQVVTNNRIAQQLGIHVMEPPAGSGTGGAQ